jgi:hypothetical protein
MMLIALPAYSPPAKVYPVTFMINDVICLGKCDFIPAGWQATRAQITIEALSK